MTKKIIKVNNGDKKCYALKDCYWRISDTNICTSPYKCINHQKHKKMKTTKEEILQKIIEKQKELIEDLLIGYFTPTTKTAKRLQVEITALNAKLEQSTSKSTIERKDFFESQMEKEQQWAVKCIKDRIK